MDESEIAQRCTFAIQVALADLLSHWGIKPDAVTGHSVGEIAAAHAAGILSLGDAVRVLWQHNLLILDVQVFVSYTFCFCEGVPKFHFGSLCGIIRIMGAFPKSRNFF